MACMSRVFAISMMIFLTAALALPTVAHADNQPRSFETAPDVEIGFLYDMSGPIEFYAAAFEAAAEISIDLLNDKQDEYNFVLVGYDSGCDDSTAQTAAGDLIDDGVELVVGALCSGASQGANSVLSSAGIPHISPTSSSPSLNDAIAYPGFFRVIPSDSLQGNVMAEVLNGTGSTNPALVYANTFQQQTVADAFELAWTEAGNSICVRVEFMEWQGDYSQEAQAVQDNGCDSVVLASYPIEGAAIVEELKAMSFDGSIVVTADVSEVTWWMDEFSNLSNADGVLAVGFQDLHSGSGSQRNQEFWGECANDSDCGGDDAIFVNQTFDAFTILAEAYMFSQIFNETLEDSLHYVGYHWEGASSNITFNETGDVAGPGFDYYEWVYHSGNDTVTPNYIDHWDVPGFDFVPDNELYGFDVFDQEDSDGDGVPDVSDDFPLDSSEWNDFDGDGIGDNADTDDDNDGILDVSDAFPLDSSEWSDFDGDGIGDNADTDDDGDGWGDVEEVECDSDPMDPLSLPSDNDADALCDIIDQDDDNDGILDVNDAFPLDSNEWNDLDGDGIGDNADTDDDNDGVVDDNDDFPEDSSEDTDTDSDGIGDNEDVDDDNDLISDAAEIEMGTDPLLADTDGDGFFDYADAFPLDSSRQREEATKSLPAFGVALVLASLVAATVFTSNSRRE